MGPEDGKINNETRYDVMGRDRITDAEEEEFEDQVRMTLPSDTALLMIKRETMESISEEGSISKRYQRVNSLESDDNNGEMNIETEPSHVDITNNPDPPLPEINDSSKGTLNPLVEPEPDPGLEAGETGTLLKASMNGSENEGEPEPIATTLVSPGLSSAVSSEGNSPDTDDDEPPPILNREEEMELEEADLEEETIRRAKEGNPAFVYAKVYATGTTKELQTFRCYKCPTAVARMELLVYHYQCHGSNSKFKCTKCDFAHNLQCVTFRHEERHVMQKVLTKNHNSPVKPANAHGSPIVPANTSGSTDVENERTDPDHPAAQIMENTGKSKVDGENELTFDKDKTNEDCLQGESSAGIIPDEPAKDIRPVAKVQPMKYSKKKKRMLFTSKARNYRQKAGKSVDNGTGAPAAHGHIFKRRNFGSAQNLSDEEYSKLRAGNPKFIYPDRFGTSNGKRVAHNTFKCWKCPSPYINYIEYVKHAGFHGANLDYKCRVCDYSAVDRRRLTQHCNLHRLQGNIPEDELTIPPEDGKFRSGTSNCNSFNADDGDIPLLGNEHEFEIEYDMDDDDVLSDSEVLNFAPAQKRLKTENHGSPLSPRNKINQRAVVVLKRLDPSWIRISPPQPRTCQDADMYSLKWKKETVFNSENYLLTELKGKNFMCFGEMSTGLHFDAIQFVSSQPEGKSSSIIAVLIALGYDVLVEGSNPTTFCGWELRDLIKRGDDTAQLEIILSLKRYPSLQDKYGSHLRLERKLIRGLPLSSCAFQISSADKSGQHSVPPKLIAMSYVRSLLKELDILPQLYRIILLDRENLKYITKYTESWYGFFEEAKNSKTKFIETKLTQLRFKMSRLDEDIAWRSAKLDFLKTQLECEYPVENPVFTSWRMKDLEMLSEAEREFVEFEAKRTELESTICTFTREISDISSTLMQQMNDMFNIFMQSQNCNGTILVDEDKKAMGIWIRENYLANQEPPTALEAQNTWLTMNTGRKTTAVFGLYLSFWKIIDSCPVFAVDSFSSSDLEFRFPSSGLKILSDLIESKSGQQFCVSLPDPPVRTGNGSQQAVKS